MSLALVGDRKDIQPQKLCNKYLHMELDRLHFSPLPLFLLLSKKDIVEQFKRGCEMFRSLLRICTGPEQMEMESQPAKARFPLPELTARQLG